MKKYKLFILFFLFAALAANFGCSAISLIKKQIDKAQTPQTITCTDGRCQLTVPGSWSIQTDLNKEANFQAANPLAEQYAIIISEAKTDFPPKTNLDGYAELIKQNAKKTTVDPVFSETKTIVVNGYPARQFELSGTINNIKANWIYTLVEAPKNYHQVLMWTIDSRYAANKPVLLEAANTFKELDGSSIPPVKGQNP
ncbi:MAG: hypothetical protein M3033_12940 [Acidobacteriota bacterium]|nr:hypothetical protein [Acidobacteriota bacterium]